MTLDRFYSGAVSIGYGSINLHTSKALEINQSDLHKGTVLWFQWFHYTSLSPVPNVRVVLLQPESAILWMCVLQDLTADYRGRVPASGSDWLNSRDVSGI